MKNTRLLMKVMLLAGLAGMAGCSANRNAATGELPVYDERPENRPPGQMTRGTTPDYSIDNEHTFPVFKDPYTVSRPQEGEYMHDYMRLYRTKEATYLTFTYYCPEDWWFFGFDSGEMLIDSETGDCYMSRGVEYYPTDTCFWINGSAGKYVRFVVEYPPLPLHVRKVDYFSPGGPTRFNFKATGHRYKDLRVDDLRPQRQYPRGRIIR